MKKTLLTLVSLLMAAVFAFGFAACSGAAKTKSFDVDALAADVDVFYGFLVQHLVSFLSINKKLTILTNRQYIIKCSRFQ